MPETGFHRAEEVFNQAVQLPRAERAGFVDQACAGDTALRRLVEDLLRHDETLLAPGSDSFVSPIDKAAKQMRRNLSPNGTGSEASPPRPVIPGFEILDELGRGGMGVVYQARQLNLNRIVALKMLLPAGIGTQEHLNRFRSEAELLARINQPNIIPIYEIGELDGRPYFTMEYIAGPSLSQCLAGKAQDLGESAQLIEVLARAIQAVHEKGIIHRDIKPANILLQVTGTKVEPGHLPSLAQAVPKISDFGLAKEFGAARELTQAGTTMGTPSYMPPEQARNRGDEIGPSVDIYALGAILYEMLTGRPPFDAGTPVETIAQLLTEDPIAPTRLRPKLPRDLVTITMKCLEKSPAQRYATASELAEDLRRFRAHEPIRARSLGPIARSWRWCRRRPLVAALTALCAALVLVLGVTVFSYQRKLETALTSAQNLAERERQRVVRLNMNMGADDWEAGDWFTAILRYAEALRVDDVATPVEPGLADRIRALLLKCPQLAHAQEQQEPVLGARVIGRDLWVVTRTGGGTLEVRDLTRARVIATLKLRGANPKVAALSADGRWLATLDDQGRPRLWNLQDGTVHEAPAAPGVPATAITFPAKMPGVVASHADASLAFWSPQGDQLVRQGTAAAKTHLSDSGRWLFHLDDHSITRVDDAHTERLARDVKLPTDVVRAEFGDAAKVVAIVGRDQSVRFQPTTAGECRMLPHQFKGTITHVRFDPASARVALADSLGGVRIWDVLTLAPITPLLKHDGQLSAIDFSHDGQELFAITQTGSVRTWNLAAKCAVPSAQPHHLAALAELLANARINEKQQCAPLTAAERRDDMEIVRTAMPGAIPIER